ncbi:DUF3318 domain-containing protein [Leptolyngbya sp. PCC 6406]|uniref:DUF3318 domain-containing protein n=1 Tax=Leptolyngbya sp. PCC 6406 TaxID=1173264 RepID=UPI0002AC208D|nr:DUF3318 domain-containing protein [Leptolyngbya sp. PCC 6406]
MAVNTNAEISRLRELMPASGRMNTRLMLDDRLTSVIETPFPRPWHRSHPITLNWVLWQEMSLPQRDLLFLQAVCWLSSVRLLKLEPYQGVVAAGAVMGIFELIQGDVVGTLAGGGLAAIAASQIWRSRQGAQSQIEADEAAIRVAQRRGYSEQEAIQYLLTAIEAVPVIEGRGVLNYLELLRTQNLRMRVQKTAATYE